MTDRDLEFWVLVGALLGAFILIHVWEPPVEFLAEVLGYGPETVLE
jgi:hypothetical protein